MAYPSVFDGYLTDDCKDCEFWSDGPFDSFGIGCCYPGPIDNCESFYKMRMKLEHSNNADKETH